MKKVLILCTGNSCRSQMAEGYLKKFSGNGAEVFSAGIEAHGMNKNAVKVMMEDGIDITGQFSKRISDLPQHDFEIVLTVCDNANERCPVFPFKAEKYHYDFPDPAKASGTEDEILNEFRKVRDQIKQYMKTFVDNIL